MIELRGVTKRFGLATIAVHNLKFEIRDQEFLVIYGPAGAGKTTTLRLIAGITKPTEGDILQDGESLLNVAPENRNMAMAFENYALYSHLSVYENLAFPLRARKLAKEDIDKQVQRIARILQIDDLLDRRPGFLSGGQRQRVALGRAIIRPASIYLLDEPIGHLDAKLRNRMRVELKAMADEQKSTVALVTTSSREALALGDRIIILRGGVIEQIGTPDAIYHRPRNEFVASFVGEPPMSFLDTEPVHEDGQLFLRPQGTPLHLPVPQQLAHSLDGHTIGYRLGVRASEITMSGQQDDVHQASGEVYVVEHLGYCNVVSVKVGDSLVRTLVEPNTRPQPKENVWLSLDCQYAHLFHDGKAIGHPTRLRGGWETLQLGGEVK